MNFKIIKIENENNLSLINNIFYNINVKIYRIENDINNFKLITKPNLNKNEINNIKFIHITKTAGTTIENIGKEHGYLWGMYDKDYLKNFNRNKYKLCSIWHVPMKYFEQNPYKDNILFTIVRNPYTRCVSEYYCPWSGNKSKDDCIKKFNIWIRNKLIQKDIVSFLPYYEYFEYNNKNIIDYVLYFENLEKEFSNLFNIKLDRYDNQSQVIKKYDINDLEKETIRMINDKYRKDFELFKYKIIKI